MFVWPQLRAARFLAVCALLQCGLIICLNSNHPQDNSNGLVQGGRITEEELPQRCDICTFPGSALRNDLVPSLTIAATRFSISAGDDLKTLEGGPKIEDISMTCSEWNDYSIQKSETLSTIDSAVCLDLRDWLSWQCCENMPPLHDCESKVEEALLSGANANYRRDRVPISGGASLDVNIFLHVDDIEIVNHGYDGGAVRAEGSIQLQWVDERLTWNSTEKGCSSIDVPHSEIWVPKITPKDKGFHDEDTLEMSRTNVMADGRIFWTGKISITAACEFAPSPSVSRICTANFVDGVDVGRVRYVTDGTEPAISYDDNVSILEYILDRNETTILVDTTVLRYSAMQNIHAQFFFRPEHEICDICGVSGKVVDGTITFYDPKLDKLYNGFEVGKKNCFEINEFLTDFSVHSEECSEGRYNFEEPCCDDELSSFECENNIYEHFTDAMDNTVTPPDPSANEDDLSLANKDRVDVSVSLDVIQLIEIEVKSNVMRMLVNLELSWYDQRLEWEPFIGGCHRASYRASTDAELTDIWVPNIELANMVEGVQDLPEAHASVDHDGKVVWRRTGPLAGICELEGINSFPFDTVSCYFDFGEDRDPEFHRINYYSGSAVQYASALEDDDFNYQEYKLQINDTEIGYRHERLSGFSNRIIRYRFYFKRASNFYLHMFVVTYILFTFLAMGMFFIDISSGERLGYGTSILFVLVAQDITMAESTPVTQEFLWIYQVSLGSKIFVIFGVIETLIAQWILQKKYFDEKEEDKGNVGNDKMFADNSRRGNDSVGVGQNQSIGETAFASNQTSRDIRSVSNISSSATTNNRRKSSVMKLRGKFISKFSTAYYSLGGKLLSLHIDEQNDSALTKTEKKVKIADVVTAFISVLAYSLFIIILSTQNKSREIVDDAFPAIG